MTVPDVELYVADQIYEIEPLQFSEPDTTEPYTNYNRNPRKTPPRPRRRRFPFARLAPSGPSINIRSNSINTHHFISDSLKLQLARSPSTTCPTPRVPERLEEDDSAEDEGMDAECDIGARDLWFVSSIAGGVLCSKERGVGEEEGVGCV